MKTIELEQNTAEWLDFRQNKIGASDLPIILGVSKWCTPYTLWSRKLGLAPGQPDNPAMARGRELEPVVRELVNKRLECAYEPLMGQHEELDWAIASLDGYDANVDVPILEIKCPGLEDHQLAEMGKVPEKYFPQLQWQLFVSDAEEVLYASYYACEVETVKVARDDAYITDVLLPAATEFYRCMIEMEEPPKGENDFMQIESPEFELAAREWKAAKEMADHYKKKSDYFKDRLVSFTDDGNCQGYGVQLRRVRREGSIDWQRLWKALQESHPTIAEDFKLDDYKNESIGYWQVRAISQ